MGIPSDVQQLPLSAWLTSSSAQKWVLSDVAPYAGPPLVALVLLPMLLILSLTLTACGCRKRLKRSRGLGCAFAGALAALTLLAGSLYALIMLLGTATAYESTAVNLTTEALQFACSTPASGSSGIGASCGTPPAPPPFAPLAPPPSCESDSLLGFAAGLGDSTDAVASATVSFVGNLLASADAFAPVINTSAAAVAIAGQVAANLTLLNSSLASVAQALAAATSIAEPYWTTCASSIDPTTCTAFWMPLQQAQALNISYVPEPLLLSASQLAAQLGASHDALVSAVDSAFEAVEMQTAPILAQVYDVNASVQSEVNALVDTFQGTLTRFNGYCSDIDTYWSGLGLPAGNGYAGTDAYDSEPISPLDLGEPALLIALGVVLTVVLPVLLLLCATLCCCLGTSAPQKYAGRCAGCGLSCVVLVALMLLLIGSVVCLTLAPVLTAACEPGVLETVLEVNLQSLGNVTLFAPPAGQTSDVNPPTSLPISTLVSEALQCGKEGFATNLIAILGLEGVIDFNGPLSNLTSSLNEQLGAFNTTALAPIDEALSQVGLAEMILLNVARTPDAVLNMRELEQLPNLTSTMINALPADTIPVPAAERTAWTALFQTLYPGSTPITDPAIRATNVALKAALATLGDSAPPVVGALTACNYTSYVLAPTVLSTLNESLLTARSVCEDAVAQGMDLAAQLEAAVDEVGLAEQVTSCAWVSTSFEHLKDLTCGPAQLQLGLLGLTLGCAALCLWVGLCGLACLRPIPAVALEWVDRSRSGRARIATGEMGTGPRDGRSAGRGAVAVERESPFAYFRQEPGSGPRAWDGMQPLPRVSATLVPGQAQYMASPASPLPPQRGPSGVYRPRSLAPDLASPDKPLIHPGSGAYDSMANSRADFDDSWSGRRREGSSSMATGYTTRGGANAEPLLRMSNPVYGDYDDDGASSASDNEGRSEKPKKFRPGKWLSRAVFGKPKRRQP